MGCAQLKDANLLKLSQTSEKGNNDHEVFHSELGDIDTPCLKSECDTKEIDKSECDTKEINKSECDTKEMDKSECDPKEMDKSECDPKEMEKSECDTKETEKSEDIPSCSTEACLQSKPDSEELPEKIQNPNATALEESENLYSNYTKFLNENEHGCYFVYKPNDNGSFFAIFSHTFVPGALAFATINPYLSVPQFKYKTPQKVCSNVDTGVSRYYEAWCLWFIFIEAYEGKTVLLPSFFDSNETNIKKFPSMKIYVLFYDKVSSFTKNNHSLVLNVRFLSAVCCVSESYAGFQIYEKFPTNVSLNDFIACANVPQNKFYSILKKRRVM